MTDAETIEHLQNALDHIARTARASRTSTRRLRWIEERAKLALKGKQFSHQAFDLPKYSEASVERIRKDSSRYRKLRNRDALAVDFVIGDLTNVYREDMDAVVDALPALPQTQPVVSEEQPA